MRACPGCGAPGLRVFYEQAAVPAHSCLLLESAAEAVAFPSGEIRLAFCWACGLVVNAAHDPALAAYTARYEDAQGFSPRFRAFAEALAADLVERHGLHGKEILEVGCGKAEFLSLLCRLGGNRGLGVDPAADPERLRPDVRDAVRLLAEPYGDRLAGLSADLVVCRHTLEHVFEAAAFLRLLAGSVTARPGTALFLEVPELRRILREGAFFDVYYEHCSYWSPGTLARLLLCTGLEVTRLRVAYDDQYLLAEARAPAGAATPPAGVEPVEELAGDVARFAARAAAAREGWSARLGDLRRAGRTAVLWGSGSKAVAFLSSVEAGHELEAIVDVNPFRHGKYLPGSGRPIVAPEALRSLRPDVVLAMNPVYREEIDSMLRGLGVAAELLTLS